MAKHQAESDYLYGLHDPGGESIMADCGCKGWVLFSEALGSDPQSDYRGNYTAYRDAGYGVIVRLNNGYYGPGTLPHSSQYENFARRCASFVASSPGAQIWIIGNETNMLAERPGAQINWERSALPRVHAAHAHTESEPTPRALRQALSVLAPSTRGGLQVNNPGETITPAMYARCYTLCRNAIRALPGHANDLVIVGAVAPWNDNTGDWIVYFQAILTALGPQGCDGIAIHTYSHGANPDLIHDESKMAAPYDRYHYNFRAYQDFMHAIPTNMRHLPVYITETDQDRDWEDRGDSAWIQRAYGEINWWNQQAAANGLYPQIRALILYRWETYDHYAIRNKGGIINDFRGALQQGYRWQPTVDPVTPLVGGSTSLAFLIGQQVYAQDWLNVRNSPGHLGKVGDLLGLLIPGTPAMIRGDVIAKDGLRWWPIRTTLDTGATVDGWAAEANATTVLLASTAPAPAPTRGVDATDTGIQQAFAQTYINLRKDAGYVGKPGDHVIGQIPHGAPVSVLAGPQQADALTWWYVRAPLIDNRTAEGWIAEIDPNGQRLLASTPPPPPASPATATTPVAAAMPGSGGIPFAVGDQATLIATANIRGVAGLLPGPEQIVATAPSGTTLTILAGPQSVDGLDWMQVAGEVMAGQAVTGWVAIADPGGVRLLAPATVAATIRVLPPFATPWPRSQGWGSWPAEYGKILYDGVPLKGHNGLDFATPVGTPLLAVDAGVVKRVDFEPDGFGNFILIAHSWGESLYAHLERIDVQQNAAVAAGQSIGLSGVTGHCYGEHLHFGLRIFPYRRTDGWGGFCDPSPFLAPAFLASTRGDGTPLAPMAPELPGRLRP